MKHVVVPGQVKPTYRPRAADWTPPDTDFEAWQDELVHGPLPWAWQRDLLSGLVVAALVTVACFWLLGCTPV